MQENIDYSKEPGKFCIKENNSNENPIISIVTAYYNASKYIKQTAYSIFNQTLKNWEWIIVNDGSSDENTDEILNNIKKMDNRVKILNQKNSGPAIARDNGIKIAKADYICILDSDDLLDKTFLECAYWSLLTNPKATWAYSNQIAFGEDEYVWIPEFDVKREKSENIIPSSGLIRKTAIIDAGGYSSYITEYHEDWKLWLLLLKNNNIPIRMNYYGFWYRRRSTGRLKTILKEPKKREKVLEKLKLLADDVSNDLVGINFPIQSNINEVKENIQYSNIIAGNEDNKNIVFFISKLNNTPKNRFYLEFIKSLKKKEFNITIITTEVCQYELRQDFESVADVFDLTTFLMKDYWYDFIIYYLRTRKIEKAIFIDDSYPNYIIPIIKLKNIQTIFIKCYYQDDECVIDNNEKMINMYYDKICFIDGQSNLKKENISANNLDQLLDIEKINFHTKSNNYENKDEIICYQYLALYNKMNETLLVKDNEIANLIKINEEQIKKQEENYNQIINSIEIEKNNILAEKNSELQKNDDIIFQKNKIIEEKQDELSKIYSGKTWKYANKISKLIKKIRK